MVARLFCKQIGGVRVPYCPREELGRYNLGSQTATVSSGRKLDKFSCAGGVSVAMPGDGSVIWTLVGILAIVALVIFIL